MIFFNWKLLGFKDLSLKGFKIVNIKSLSKKQDFKKCYVLKINKINVQLWLHF